MWCSSADPIFDAVTLGISTFVAERLARGQLDLVVTQAVLGPGLVHDLVDLLPLAELAEVAIGHGLAARGGGVQGGYTSRRGPTVRSAARAIAAELFDTCAISAGDRRSVFSLLACCLLCMLASVSLR